MSDVIKLLASRWDQEEFFTISDVVLIASGIDKIFKTVEEFQIYAQEISRLWDVEMGKARTGNIKDKQLDSHSKVSKCRLHWMNWVGLCFDHVCLKSITKLEEMTLEELDQLKKQVAKHLSIFEKLILSKKLGDQYIESISSITKEYLDIWLIDSLNGNYLSKSLEGNFQIIKVQPIETTVSNVTQNTIKNKANTPITINSPATLKKSTPLDKAQPRQIGLSSELVDLIINESETVMNIKTKEDIKNAILNKRKMYKYKETKPLGLSKRSIEKCFTEIKSYRDKYPLPQ